VTSDSCVTAPGEALHGRELDAHGPKVVICRVDPSWLPHLEGVHSVSRVGECEVIDGGISR